MRLLMVVHSWPPFRLLPRLRLNEPPPTPREKVASRGPDDARSLFFTRALLRAASWIAARAEGDGGSGSGPWLQSREQAVCPASLHRCRATSPLTPTARRSIDCPHTRAARSCWSLERVVHECMRRFPTLTHSRRDLCAPCSRAKPRSKESACCTNYGITLFQGRIENFRVQSASCRSKRARKRTQAAGQSFPCPRSAFNFFFGCDDFWPRSSVNAQCGHCPRKIFDPRDQILCQPHVHVNGMETPYFFSRGFWTISDVFNVAQGNAFWEIF